MECEFCHRILSSKSALHTHQTKTKYCLKIQGKTIKGKYSCKCGKNFQIKQHLVNHQDACILNTDKIRELHSKIITLEQENKVLKQQLEDSMRREQEIRDDFNKLAAISAKKSTNTTTNNINNTVNLGVFDKSAADIKRIVDEKYNREYLLQGQKGVAIFTQKHVINTEPDKPPIYIITDHSRGNGKYKISDTETVTDQGLSGLTKKIHPSIKKRLFIL